jgi:PadR family transcriptional regulator PadR
MEKENTFEKLENTKAQMRKGVLELCVLSIIAQKEAYPTDIIEHLRASKLIVVEGTLYPLLNRLKNAGLLTYNWQEATDGRKGPPRKYYDLTKEGKTFLNELQVTWDDLVEAVHQITNNISANE